MKWLVESEIFQGDAEPLIEALEKLNVPYTRCKFGTPYEEYIRLAGTDLTIFYGSLQFGKLIQDTPGHNIKVYCTLPNYECVNYYPHFGDRLLNANNTTIPFSELVRFRTCQESMFVRPSSGYKTFTGDVVDPDRLEWDSAIHLWKLKINPDDLVIVSKSQSISKEWRMVVIDGRVVTGGQYKQDGQIVRISEVPAAVMEYAQQTVDDVQYYPDPAWTIDICQVAYQLKVLEIGSFSCAGLYACDCEAIVKGIAELVCKNQ